MNELQENGQRLVAEAKYEAAIVCFEEMQKLAVLCGDEMSEALSLQGLGIAFNLQGQYAHASEVISRSIDIHRRIGNTLGEAQSRISLGNMCLSKGDYSQAIENYSGSLSLFRTFSDLGGEAAACHSLGNAYHQIGQYDRALEMLNRSLLISRQIGNSEFESASSQGLGSLYEQTGQYDCALDHLKVAMDIYARTGDLEGQGKAYLTLGSVFESLGQFDSALEMHTRSLEIKQRIGDASGEGRSQNSLGNVYHALGQHELALEFLAHALEIALRVGDIEGQARSYYALGLVRVSLGDIAGAVHSFSAAISACEELQGSLAGRDQERVAIFEQQRRCYVHLVDCLLRMERNEEALAASERGKARALRALMGGVAPHDTAGQAAADSVEGEDIRRMAQEEGCAVLSFSLLEEHEVAIWLLSPSGDLLAAGRASLAGNTAGSVGTITGELELALCALGAQGRDALARDSGRAPAERPGTAAQGSAGETWERRVLRCLRLDRPRIGGGPLRVTARVDEGSAVLAELQAEPVAYREAMALLRRHGNMCGWLDSLCAADGGVGGAAAALDGEGLQQAVAVLKERVYGWSDLRDLTHDALATYGVGDRAVRAHVLRRIRTALDADRLLRGLHALLIEPVAEELQSLPDLLIVPDMQLWVTPWAALLGPDGRRLVQHHSIRLAPSQAVAREAARAAAAAKGGSAGRRALVVGSPVHSRFAPLPHAADEANAVAVLFGVQPMVGMRATKAQVCPALATASWVHLACHGCLEKQAIVLASVGDEGDAAAGDDGLLTAGEVQAGPALAGRPTVILSACSTARGEIRGEGVLGLSRAFLAAGAAAAVVSLWSVPDERTRLLMDAMYAALDQGYHAPQALRFAMIMAIDHGQLPPLAWAGFVIAGASTALPESSGCGSAGVEAWSVDDLCALLVRCGLPSQSVLENRVDGKTLLQLSDQEIMSELGLRTLQVKRLKAECAQVTNTPTVDQQRPARSPAEFDLKAMEKEFNRSHGAWFTRICGEQGSDSRNFKDPKGSEDFAALAGSKEKEALRAIGFDFTVNGCEISMENGYILSNGFLSKGALEKCLGLVHPDTYSSLWGSEGKVWQLVKDKLAVDPEFRIELVIDNIREAAAFRKKDLDKHCKIRSAFRVAIAKFFSQRLGLRVKESCVNIIDMVEKSEHLEIEFTVDFSSLADAERALSVVVSADILPSLLNEELLKIKGQKMEDFTLSMPLAEDTTVVISRSRILPEKNEVKGCFSAVLVFVGGFSCYEDLCCLLTDKEREKVKRHEYQQQKMHECLESVSKLLR